MTALDSTVRPRSVLRERDLLIIAIANFVSVTGDAAAIIALGLRLHGAGGGGWTIAALLLAGTVPLVFLAPLAGRLVDRMDSRTAITAAVLVQAACAGALIAATSTWLVLALLAMLSAAGSVVTPATGALIPLVVGHDRIARASGVTEAAFVMGNLIGPALGGALTGALGTRAPLLLDTVSFALVAAGMSLVRTRRRPSPDVEPAGTVRASGSSVIKADRVLLAVVAVLAGLVLMCGAVNVAEIFLMKDALRTSDAIYGVISACWMAGMMMGSTGIARYGRGDESLLTSIGLAILVVALGLVVAGVAPVWPVAAGAFVVGGVGNGMLTVASQTLIARRTPQHMRGRVGGVVTAWVNAALVGAFAAGGLLVAAVGPRPTVIGCGVAAGGVGVVFSALIRSGRAHAPDTVPAWTAR